MPNLHFTRLFAAAESSYRQYAALPGRLPKAWAIFILLEVFLCIAVLTSYSTRAVESAASAVGPWDVSSMVDPTKVALLIGTNASPLYVPAILHFANTLPHDWKIVFTGSDSTVAQVTSVPSVKQLVEIGKVDTLFLPGHISLTSAKELSKFLTQKWTYETLLHPAEWLLVFQTDSILCSNSERNVNQYTQWSWVGAPWPGRTYGGNGGLSLRKVESVINLLSNHTRDDNDEAEDLWLVQTMLANGIEDIAPQNVGKYFGVENIYAYHPMSYHTGGSGKYLHSAQFQGRERREEVYDWCPELKMHIDMDLAEFLPGECEPSNWMRRRELADGFDDHDTL